MLREATFWELKTPDIRKLFPANLWPALSVLRHTSPTPFRYRSTMIGTC